MQAVAVLLVLYLVLVLLVFPIWAVIRLVSRDRERDSLRLRLSDLETEVRQLRATINDQLGSSPSVPPAEGAVSGHDELRAQSAATTPPAPAPFLAPAVLASPAATMPSPAPALPPTLAPAPPPIVPLAPPPLAPRPAEMPPPAPAAPRFNWEQFMGARLFLWLGGIIAFLAVAYFVKYSFDHDLIPPEMRVSLGFLLGAGLIVAGLKLSTGRFAVQAQTLCATGIVSLYAVAFACNAHYHFAFFTTIPTFLLMALITTAAFLLAVRLEAQVVALLGLLGGFLTPVLLSTGQDNPVGLFGYVALLDVGLIAVALHRRWPHLVPLAASGTVIMQIAWAARFFEAAKAPAAVVICLGFAALFLAACEVARRLQRRTPHLIGSAVALAFVALGFALSFISYRAVASRADLWFGFVFLADAVLLTLAWRDERLPKLHLFAGMAVFALLAAWTAEILADDLLNWALAGYLVFAALHTAFPLVLQRLRPAAAPAWWSQLFPPLALLLMLGPLFKLTAVSLQLWPVILLVDALAVLLALFTGSLAALGLVLLLSLGAAAVFIVKPATNLVDLPVLLLIVGGFAVAFFAAGIFLARRLGDRPGESSGGRQALSSVFGGTRAQIPAFSALLPFVLLMMMTLRLPLADPSPVFGLALLLVVLTLGLALLLEVEWLPACALAGLAALECVWHQGHFSAEAAATPLAWYLGFYLLLVVYPFGFRARLVALTGPWAVAALAGVVQFPLVYDLVKTAWPNDYLGALPALFAVPPLAGLAVVLRSGPADQPARLNQLAWFGGVALLFITLIFPIQFNRQWITLGWALEGAALLWLFHRVPHPGLRAVGVALLMVAFVRLALNPAVLRYHPRADTAIFNWYLYAYGIVTAALFAGGRLLAPPRERLLGVDVRPWLFGLGAVLAFLLLNLEIADYFSAPGRRVLTFQFSGNFARDLAYTVGWALFALGLLGAGIRWRTRAARYAALGLLGVTVLKLFLHDLAHLGQLYRVAALFVVAVIAIAASFLYQRFVPSDETPPPS